MSSAVATMTTTSVPDQRRELREKLRTHRARAAGVLGAQRARASLLSEVVAAARRLSDGELPGLVVDLRKRVFPQEKRALVGRIVALLEEHADLWQLRTLDDLLVKRPTEPAAPVEVE